MNLTNQSQMPELSIPSIRLVPAVGLVSFSMLLFEMTFFQIVHQLSNYTLAVYSIAIALMGLIAGGVVAFLASDSLLKRPGIIAVIPLLMAGAVGLSLADVLWLHTVDWLYFFAAGMLVFLLAGMFLSHAFVLHDSFRIYAADMLGAGLGVTSAVVLVPLVLEENTLLISMALPLVAAGLVAFRYRIWLLAGLAGMSVVLVFVAINHDTGVFNAVRDASPSSFTNPTSLTMSNDSKWVASRSSMCGRLDFAKPRMQPVPGRKIPENPLGIDTPFIRTYNNNRPLDGVNIASGEELVPDVRLAEALFEDGPPKILVIGAAAQGAIKEAVVLGGGKATAVEINPATIDVMTGDLAAYSRHAYRGVDLTQIDVRTYLMGSQEQFDLITMLNLHNFYIGFDPIPESVFTTEAIRTYFEHLTENGVIDVEEMIFQVDPGSADPKAWANFSLATQKELANFARVLAEQDLGDSPGRFVYVYRWQRSNHPSVQWFFQFLIKKTPFSVDEIARMDAWVEQLNSDDLKTQLIYPAPSELHDLVAEAMDYASFPALTDDRPFNLAPFLTDYQTSLNAMTLILGLLALGVLALPLRRFIRAARQTRRTWLLAVYFLISGLAYMGFEITIFQKNQIYLGSVGMSLVISTAVMMACSGLGSLVAAYVSERTRLWLISAIPLTLAVLGLMIVPLFGWSGFWFESTWLRALVVVLLIGPASFLMGVPFAAGMDSIRRRTSPVFATYMFALNGVAASMGTLLAFNLSIHFGFQLLLWSSLVLYLLVAGLAWLTLRPGAEDLCRS